MMLAIAEALIISTNSLPYGRSAVIKACGKNDPPKDGEGVQAECVSGLALPGRDRPNRAGKDLRLIGCGVERKSENGAVIGVAKEPPEADLAKLQSELAGAVVDQEGLGDHRRATEEVGVGIGKPTS